MCEVTCTNMCENMRQDMCIGMRIDMCIDTDRRVHRCIDGDGIPGDDSSVFGGGRR